MLRRWYETEWRDFPASTPLAVIRPDAVQVLSTSSGVMAHYQKQMSKAVWRPAPGRKLGFLVVQDDYLLGLIFLASPVIRLAARDNYLFPNPPAGFNYGLATREYLDMSVCVAAQPIGWHWNLGKLMAMIAPTLGDYVEARYPEDKFKGVTTTSLYGGSKATQYTRIYKYLGETEGFGHEHVTDDEYKDMMAYMRNHGVPIPSARFGDGSNTRMRRISAYNNAVGIISINGKSPLSHGNTRGVYYHPAVPPEQRALVIQNWYERWGLPRYARTKNLEPPYQSGRALQPSADAPTRSEAVAA